MYLAESLWPRRYGLPLPASVQMVRLKDTVLAESSSLTYPGFSARAILRFMHNHHLLQITGKPKWLTVKGGRFVDNTLIPK